MAENEVLSEDPSVVKGSVLDTPMESEPVTPPAAQSQEPLYKGFLGDIKTQDELKTYAQTLEQMVVQAKAESQNRNAPPAQVTPPPHVQSARERFSETIFSKPEEAYDILLQDAKNQLAQQTAAVDREKQFWSDFYTKNEDLKGMEKVVQSIAEAKRAELSRLPDSKSVEEYLTKEVRSIADVFKKKYGGVETRLESRPAVTLGSSGEPIQHQPQAISTENKSLTAQIFALQNKRRK